MLFSFDLVFSNVFAMFQIDFKRMPSPDLQVPYGFAISSHGFDSALAKASVYLVFLLRRMVS